MKAQKLSCNSCATTFHVKSEMKNDIGFRFQSNKPL